MMVFVKWAKSNKFYLFFIEGLLGKKSQNMRSDDDEELQERNENPAEQANLISKLIFW